MLHFYAPFVLISCQKEDIAICMAVDTARKEWKRKTATIMEESIGGLHEKQKRGRRQTTFDLNGIESLRHIHENCAS